MLRGDLEKAKTSAEQAYLHFSGRDLQWAWKFRLLEAEVMGWQGLNKEVLQLLDSDLPASLSHGDLGVQRHLLRALAFARLGQFQDADRNLSESLRGCEFWRCESAGDLARTAGVIEVQRNDLEKAEQYFHLSMRLAHERGDQFLDCTALLNLGFLALNREHFDESIDWSEKALTVSRGIGWRMIEEKSLGNLGWDYYKMGDFDRSLEYYLAAVQKARELQIVYDEMTWLTNLGLIYFETNQLGLAREKYQESLLLARRMQSFDVILANLNALALLSIQTDHIDDASVYTREALGLARSVGDHADEVDALLANGLIAARSRDQATAEKLFREVARNSASDTSLRWEAQNSLAKLLESEGRISAADIQYREALTTVEQARAAIQHEDFRLPFLSNAVHLYDDYIDFLIKQGKTAAALEQADYSRAQTLTEGLRLDRRHESASPASIDAQQLARHTDSTILFYWLGPKHAYLWAITPKQIRLFPLPPTSEIEAKVERYNQALTRPRDPLDTDNPDGTNLYRILVEPVQSLIRGDNRVIILPDGSLNTLNFETLLVTDPKPHYWIEDVTVETAPALSLIQDRNLPQRRSGKLLLIGDPISADESFGQLPNAAVEIADIEKHFSVATREVFTREQATPEAYLSSRPQQFSFIHFVAHGTASRLTPLESGVVLSKAEEESASKLYARDIVAHPLQAELVTVSTCYGAGTRYYTGEGLVGLSWAFLRAGAHHVIGALWEVNDASTPAFMDQLYADLEKGRSPADALHTAKLRMLHSQGVLRKPYYWATFQLYMGS
jgi:CHAT domain-containing protein